VENLIVELKHPEIKLGEKELSQVKRYLSVIAEEPRFNDTTAIWRFYLIGNDYDKFIERELESNKVHQEHGLVQRFDNFRIYVKKWSEIFNEFKIRHKFLSERLIDERAKLSSSVADSKISIHEALATSSAKSPKEMNEPNVG
jgi:hypothetical protein